MWYSVYVQNIKVKTVEEYMNIIYIYIHILSYHTTIYPTISYHTVLPAQQHMSYLTPGSCHLTPGSCHLTPGSF